MNGARLGSYTVERHGILHGKNGGVLLDEAGSGFVADMVSEEALDELHGLLPPPGETPAQVEVTAELKESVDFVTAGVYVTVRLGCRQTEEHIDTTRRIASEMAKDWAAEYFREVTKIVEAETRVPRRQR